MKKGDFISIVDDPSKINGSNIPELKRLLRAFPFFSTAHVLLTKAYLKEEHINFEQQLRKSAAYASDRSQLHELLFPKSRNHPKDKEKETTASNEDNHSEIEERSQTGKRVPRKDDPLEAQILTEAINSSILQEIEEKQKTEHKAASNIAKEKKANTEFDVSKKHNFDAWLSYYSDKTAQKQEENELWENTSKSSKDAIKSFSQARPKKQQDFYSASKMAKLSVKEDNDLVTETLAKIYAAQENYDKAIKAYQKLQLKYPEKKVYFAAQIKALKNNLNTS